MKYSNLFILLFFGSFLRGQCTVESEPDMAKYKKLTEEKDAQGCSQCAVLALYFCSAKYCVDMEDKRKVRSMIEACKGNIRNMGQPYCCNDLLGREPQWGILASTNQESKSSSSANDENARLEKNISSALNSFYAIEAALNARNDLRANTTFSGTYNTIQELDAAFKEKMAGISKNIQEIESANTALLVSGAELLINNTNNEVTQIVGGVAVGVGAILLDANSEKQKQNAEEKLKSERDKQVQIIEERKRLQYFEFRKEIFTNFKDGGLPISSHKIDNKKVYLFSYIIEPDSLKNDSFNIMISNVFSVSKFSDDTWPFKNSLVNNISKKSNGIGKVIIMGYYISETEAEITKKSLLGILNTAKARIIEFKFNWDDIVDNNDKDFWGNQKQNSIDSGKEASFWDK
jgi:hypothetical protein